MPYLGPMADWLAEQDSELEIFHVDGDGVNHLTFNKPLLEMKAMQALSTALKRIETLEAEVAALKGPGTADIQGGSN